MLSHLSRDTLKAIFEISVALCVTVFVRSRRYLYPNKYGHDLTPVIYNMLILRIFNFGN